jgi:hypothetical protein
LSMIWHIIISHLRLRHIKMKIISNFLNQNGKITFSFVIFILKVEKKKRKKNEKNRKFVIFFVILILNGLRKDGRGKENKTYQVC